MTAWVVDWLRAFGLTLAAEALVAVPLLRRSGAGLGRRLAAVLFANLTTHPLVWFLFPALTVGYPTRLAVSETFAVGLESCAYLVIWPGLGPRRAVLVSVLANAASVAVGLALRTAHLLP